LRLDPGQQEGRQQEDTDRVEFIQVGTGEKEGLRRIIPRVHTMQRKELQPAAE
jgi:hypothetical protein